MNPQAQISHFKLFTKLTLCVGYGEEVGVAQQVSTNRKVTPFIFGKMPWSIASSLKLHTRILHLLTYNLSDMLPLSPRNYLQFLVISYHN